MLPQFFPSVIFLFIFIQYSFGSDETVSKLDENKFEVAKDRRFLLYDVNFGEGFNLRRDVYLRISNLVRQLRQKGQNFILVLPPFGGLYHWQTRDLGPQLRLPWNLFFDLESLNHFVPVVEFEDFLKETGSKIIDHVYYLQHYVEGWSGRWEEKWDYRPCIEAERMFRFNEETQLWDGWFFGYRDEVNARKLDCISVQGQSSTLIPLILQENQTARSIMIDRGETVLHDIFGDRYFWMARRSMRYSNQLIRLADEFREKELNSVDDLDQTIVTKDWRSMEIPHGTAKGGPFLCIHWRRKDFVRAHEKELPSISGTTKQIVAALDRLNLTTVFLATDAPDDEVRSLIEKLPERVRLVKYRPPPEILLKYKDGGISIIDQWICAHARHFIGSHVSTFSFRIQEDREILGFEPSSTFNRLCPDESIDNCEQPAKWKIVY